MDFFQTVKAALDFGLWSDKTPIEDRLDSYSNDQFSWFYCAIGAEQRLVLAVSPLVATAMSVQMYDCPANQLSLQETFDAVTEVTNIMAGLVQKKYWPNHEIGLAQAMELTEAERFTCRNCELSTMISVDGGILFVGVATGKARD
ncbi:hypothetical protein [Reinekea sp.]|uniref:hypothetical protein n=1 Tax=Reinekea sp. TaxID=1970455 RepID=UPI002A822765|nr:hypothetical protein [Reinekea sp.]